MHDETNQLSAGGTMSVLVVEDEFLIAMDVKMILEENGHSVLGPAASVKSALNLLKDARLGSAQR